MTASLQPKVPSSESLAAPTKLLALSSQRLALESRLTANGYELTADVTRGSV